MEAAEEHQQHHFSSSQQRFDDIEAASAGRDRLRELGRSKLDAVLSKAQAGHDPFEHQERPQRLGGDSAEVQDADIAAMGAWLERHRPLLLAGGFVVAQGASWVLLKNCLTAMHTPAVLTFLHLLAAALLHLALVWWGVLPAPQLSAAAAKGASLPAAIAALQLLLVTWALEHASVFLLLCWVTTAPLLLSVTRASDVAKKRWLVPSPSKQWPWVAAAAAGLVLEVLLDRNAHSALAFSGLLLWALVYVCDMLWAQLKVDATLGHTIMEPNFLFHVRELTDLEATLSPSSRALLTAALPALPVLVLGLVSLEAKDLVDHEPSVPTLEALLLSCIAFAAQHNLTAVMAGSSTLNHSHMLLLQAAAAALAVVLELVERTPASSWCLLGVALSIAGCCSSHLQSMGLQSRHRG